MTTQEQAASRRRAAAKRAKIEAATKMPIPDDILWMREQAAMSTEAFIRYRDDLRAFAAKHCRKPKNGPSQSEANGTCVICRGWKSPVSGSCRRCGRR